MPSMMQHHGACTPPSLKLPYALTMDLALGGNHLQRGNSLQDFWQEASQNYFRRGDEEDTPSTPQQRESLSPEMERSACSNSKSSSNGSDSEKSVQGSSLKLVDREIQPVSGRGSARDRGFFGTLSRGLSNKFLAQFTSAAAHSSYKSAPADAIPAKANALVTPNMAGGSKWLLDMKRVELGSIIATGMSGKVYNGLYDGQSVALKILRVPETAAESENLNKQFNAEFLTLQGLQHENVVKLVGVCARGDFKCLVTELVPDGTLRDMLKKRQEPLPLPRVVSMALDIARGMAYLHSKGIILRDLKSENLLLSKEGTVKICDLGSSKSDHQNAIRECHTGEVGTLRWMAPEVMDCQPYGRKVDVYSFSIVVWEMLTSAMPYPDMTPYQVAYAVFHKDLRPPIPATCPLQLATLLSQCWVKDPKNRPEFRQIIRSLKSMPTF